MINEYTKAPRIYGDYDLTVGSEVILNDDHCHYLLSVMRRDDGDYIRIFNGKDGEFAGKLVKKSKKSALIHINHKIYDQKDEKYKKSLYFSPIKKDKMSFLIEKSVELGVTDFYPIISDHTENRKFNVDKLHRYMIEGAEQCERLTIPILHEAQSIDDIATLDTPIHCAMERQDKPFFAPNTNQDIACLVGPEGGWSKREIELLLNAPNIAPVSLGTNILRAETAAICMLARLL
jgi:16S rRNA (uracil1498-N3)-methyltransferase